MALPLPARYKYRENKSVQKAVDKAAPESLRSAGAYVRAIAMNSISVRRPKKADKGHYEVQASLAGNPPFDHGWPNNGGRNKHGTSNFKKSILFAMTRDNSTVVVGPKLQRGGVNNIARLHEFGGTRQIPRIDFHLWNDGPDIGEYGPMREGHMTHFDTTLGKPELYKDPVTGQRIVWVKIRKPYQREISRRLYRRYFKKHARMITAHFPQRPYMAPALRRALPKLASFWAGTVKP
jgi:hypothetical protein